MGRAPSAPSIENKNTTFVIQKTDSYNRSLVAQSGARRSTVFTVSRKRLSAKVEIKRITPRKDTCTQPTDTFEMTRKQYIQKEQRNPGRSPPIFISKCHKHHKTRGGGQFLKKPCRQNLGEVAHRSKTEFYYSFSDSTFNNSTC